VAGALSCRSANTAEWQAVFPRHTGDHKSKERSLSRFLSHPLLHPIAVMGSFIAEMAAMAGAHGKTVILMMDQSKIRDGLECLMVSMRVGERAIPVAWRVKEVKGNLGFEEQKLLLEAVYAMMPIGLSILLAADRFYGASALIRGCQAHGWQSRIRRKDNLILRQQGGEITTGEAAKANRAAVLNATCNESE
jgi:hypothetical protein